MLEWVTETLTPTRSAPVPRQGRSGRELSPRSAYRVWMRLPIPTPGCRRREYETFREGPCWPLLVAVLGVAVLGRITDRGSSDGQLAWAQVAASSCGNAIVEPGEQCDPPGSITCPAGSPASAFLPCSATCTCPATVLDHFQCYEVKPAFFSQVTVTVQDQFGTLHETLRYPHRLCAPASKNGEGIRIHRSPMAIVQGRVWFHEAAGQTLVDQLEPSCRRRVRQPLGADRRGRRGAATARPLPVLQGEAVEGSQVRGAPSPV
jgi:hypothetical protein